jgi:hypothetical protein
VKNERKRVKRAVGVSFDIEKERAKEKRIKIAADLYDAIMVPVENPDVQVQLTMAGLIAAVERRAGIEGVDLVAAERVETGGGLLECDAALDALVDVSPDTVEAALKGTQKNIVNWKHRAAGAFLFLHPGIYGEGDFVTRTRKVAGALGVEHKTLGKWLSLKNEASMSYIEKWLPIVENMTWKDAAGSFKSDWAEQWMVRDDEKISEDLLAPYKDRVKGSKTTFLSKYTPGTTTSGRKSTAKNDKSTIILKDSTKRSERSDVKKPRKFAAQEKALIEVVAERWGLGDPIGRIELRDEIIARDDCQEGHVDEHGDDFYKTHLDPRKPSSASGFANWVKRVLNRAGWSFRKNSVGQTVPPDWRKKAERNAAKITKRFKDEEVDVVLNADQTFVNFYMEETEVVAPTGIKRVGGRVKAEVKKGFTAMVAVNLKTSEMDPPFVVYNGTKLSSARNPERTLWYKHRNWRNSAPGRTGRMVFQKKHWFDEDITIVWFDWILNVQYPGKKVGISMDMAPCQTGAKVRQYIAEKTSEGRLIVVFIDGGLTSVLQVCDLAANKEFKDNIKRLYLKYRTGFLWAERAKTPDEPNRRIKTKIPVVRMTEIIEEAVKEFNTGQLETRSILKTFISAGQHPWKVCEVQFKAHLDNLSKLPLYGGCKTVQEVLQERAMASRTGETLHPGREAVGVGLEEEEVDLEPEAAAEEEEAGEVEFLGAQGAV